MELVVVVQIVAFGEGMVEIAGNVGGTGRIGFGGDVLNVAVGLARFGLAPMFLSALGCDRWSDELIAIWANEGVGVSLVARDAVRMPGLYGIRTDAGGERSFGYWRGNSAARAFFEHPECEALLAAAAQADLLFLSGITLSLYDDAARARIAALAARVRERGGAVAFDGNYRPSGWPDADTARTAFRSFAPFVTLALPTASDEAMLYGHAESPQAIAARWHDSGAGEVAVKLGDAGAYVSFAGGAEFVPTTAVAPVDTSGAGDAFDAAYIAARLAGQAPPDAARFGHRLAGVTILYEGAIPPREAVAYLQRELPIPVQQRC